MHLKVFLKLETSVADPGCLSRIPDPDFYPSRIPDLGSRIQKQQRQGWKIFFCQTIFCSHKFRKTQYYFIFYMLKKKIWPNFPSFYPKNCHQALNNMGLGSEIRDPEKTYSGSRIQGSKRHRSRILDPGSGSATLLETLSSGQIYIKKDQENPPKKPLG